MSKETETFNKFGVITETYENVLKASNLASEILVYMDNNFKESFFIMHCIEYNFIDTKKDGELTKQMVKENLPIVENRVRYLTLLDECQMKLTFPIIKNYGVVVKPISTLINDYTYLVNLLDGVFINGRLFAASTMRYINRINNRTLKRFKNE